MRGAAVNLSLEESMVDGMNGAGVVVESGAYRLVNNVITRNGNAVEPYGVSLGNLTSGEFLLNTVVANGRGVLCASQNPLTASVVSDNLGRLDEQVQGSCKVSDVATRVDDLTAADKALVTPERLKLQRSFVLHQQCCIDRIDLERCRFRLCGTTLVARVRKESRQTSDSTSLIRSSGRAETTSYSVGRGIGAPANISKESRREIPMEGQVIAGYRIERTIGSGGMGIVFEGVHQHLGRRVAIKLLHDRYCHD